VIHVIVIDVKLHYCVRFRRGAGLSHRRHQAEHIVVVSCDALYVIEEISGEGADYDHILSQICNGCVGDRDQPWPREVAFSPELRCSHNRQRQTDVAG